MGDSGVQKKKLNKNKLKKTIKNVLCRPDPLTWPVVSDDQKKTFEAALCKHKVELPIFKKPHWNELKLIPKDQRPKSPKLLRVNGLLFGITECCNAIEGKQCSAVIIESMVNPRVVVQPVIEACKKSHVPFICCQNLRKTSEQNFGIPTSCLGIKLNSLPELTSAVLEIAKNYIEPSKMSHQKDVEIMDIDKTKQDTTSIKGSTQVTAVKNMLCPYLYRSNKQSRVFVPNGSVVPALISKDFTGQNYIQFSDKPTPKQTNRKDFKTMMVKRISNNPNRVKS